MTTKRYYENIKSLPWFVWAGIYTLEIWLINLAAPLSLEWSAEYRGTFGDMFGAANSLFSAFAVIGVAWSVSMQRTELSIARDDREKTRTILSEQQENLKIQRFETTFYQLFTAFQGIIENIEVETSSGKGVSIQASERVTVTRTPSSAVRGRRAIEIILSRLEQKFYAQGEWANSKDREGHERAEDWEEDIQSRALDDFGRAYLNIYSEYGSDLGRYFRSIYTILNLIDVSEIPEVTKPFYYKLLRAQLSQQESTLLALNYLTPNTTDKFNKLTVCFGMAKNADRSNPILESVLHQLPPSLFGRTYAKQQDSYART